MEIKNGKVQWNGRNDIPCSYIVMEDGTQYYIKQELSNGNYVITTSLLEAVDPMTKAKNIGLLSADGNMIISATNSSIKVLGDNLLLVVPSEPVSENVKEAISLRLDPLSATKLVSTPAQIKEKINANMSAEGRYELYDQFQEGTLCDANGNNLLNDEYYSFVAKDNDKILLAKNNIDTEVKEFSMTDNKIVEEEKVVPVEEVNEVIPTEEVQPVEEVVTEPVVEEPPVEENNEVITDLGEETSIDDVEPDFSFDEISSETPTEVVDNGEENDVKADDYMHEAETDRALKSMSEKTEDIAKETSALDQFMVNDQPEIEEYEFTEPDVKVDNIEREEDDDADILVDATRILNSVTDMVSERDEKIKSLEAEKDNIRKQYEEENANLRKELEEIKKDSKNREARDAQEIEYLKGENQEQESTIKKQSAQIDSLKDVVDLYKRKEEETRRSMKTLARSVKSLEALTIGSEADNEDNYSYRRVA